MKIRQLLVFFAAIILKKIPTHRNRKRFAKIVGPFFHGTIAKTAYGFPMIVRWYDNMNRIGFEGSYGIVAEFIQNLPHNVMFIDIGANQGCTSILASKVFKRNKKNINGAVMAFEPSVSVFNLMKKNIILNNCKNIYVYNKAITSKNSELFLNEEDNHNSGASHISNSGSKIYGSPLKSSDVMALGKYDDIYIKIDTEGYEMSVLNGIKDLFDTRLVRKVVIEIDNDNLNKYGNSSEDVYKFFNNYGFNATIGHKQGHYDEVFSE